MFKCSCGNTFENKAGLESHRNWCDRSDKDGLEHIKCPKCGSGVPESYFEEHIGSKKCRRKRGKVKIHTNETCDYGCEKIANWELKNGNKCCSKYPSSCPKIRKKNSNKIKELYQKGEWVPTNDGGCKNSWNEGKSYEDVLGKKAAEKYKNRLSNSVSEYYENMSEEDKKEWLNSLKKSLNESDKVGGYRKEGGRSNGQWYDSPIAGEVWLDSSYELAYAKWLDENEVKWERNTEKFGYIYEENEKSYIPDFYLVHEDKYVEVKGFETEKDHAKWEDFPHKLEVLKKKDLLELGCDLYL